MQIVLHKCGHTNKRRTEQAKKEYLRQLASYRATLVSKGNTLESPYNGKGLADVTKVGEPGDRSYLMNPRFVVNPQTLPSQSFNFICYSH